MPALQHAPPRSRIEPLPVAWQISAPLVAYDDAVSTMEARVFDIHCGAASEIVWLLEHPDLYTAGTSAKSQDLLNSSAFPVFRTGRGGQYTYHGPGQRIAYVMLDVRQRFGGDVRAFVTALERWGRATLSHFGIEGRTFPDRVGLWVNGPSDMVDGVDTADGSDFRHKIAAIGIRIRHGISYHGLALNISPNLDRYEGIVPCGLKGFGVTSLAQLGVHATMQDVDAVLIKTFAESVLSVPAAAKLD